MGNYLVGNPLFIDNVTGASVTGVRLVKAIAWVNTEHKDIAAADDFALTDGGSNPIIEKRAVAAGDDLLIVFPTPMEFNGLIVSELDGGACYIYQK